MHKKVIGIGRASRYSPGSQHADAAILQAVLNKLSGDVVLVDELEWLGNETPAQAVYVSMARSADALQRLQQLQQQGAIVVNDPRSVRTRYDLEQCMRSNNIALPAPWGNNGTWVKRGDGAAETALDVQFCATHDKMEQTIADMKARGVQQVVTQAHVEGDLLKWYAVGNRFFKYYYPTDDGISKFGDEHRNGVARHYAFDVAALHSEVKKVAQLVGLDVFGGDAVIDANGAFYLIDVNDWPSFARCRAEAADEIAAVVTQKINERNTNGYI